MNNFPHSYIFMVETVVPGSLAIEQAIKNGAPNTPASMLGHLNAMPDKFPPTSTGSQRKKVLLVCFGEFVNQKHAERFTAEVKATHKLVDMHMRTMLALGDDHRRLCQEKGVRRMRLVCFSPKVRHMDLWHIPTLHQEDRNACITNALMLEPYAFGWSAEHVFGFERTVP